MIRVVLIDEINGEIARLEAQTQTYQTVEKLAMLYIVRDHNTIPTNQITPAETGPVQVEATSPFLSLCAGEPVCDVMAVMDDLMSTIQVLMPRLYDGVMRRLEK